MISGGHSYTFTVHQLKEVELVGNVIGMKINTNAIIMNEFLINIIKTLKEEKLHEVHMNPLSVKFR